MLQLIVGIVCLAAVASSTVKHTQAYPNAAPPTSAIVVNQTCFDDKDCSGYGNCDKQLGNCVCSSTPTGDFSGSFCEVPPPCPMGESECYKTNHCGWLVTTDYEGGGCVLGDNFGPNAPVPQGTRSWQPGFGKDAKWFVCAYLCASYTESRCMEGPFCFGGQAGVACTDGEATPEVKMFPTNDQGACESYDDAFKFPATNPPTPTPPSPEPPSPAPPTPSHLKPACFACTAFVSHLAEQLADAEEECDEIAAAAKTKFCHDSACTANPFTWPHCVCNAVVQTAKTVVCSTWAKIVDTAPACGLTLDPFQTCTITAHCRHQQSHGSHLDVASMAKHSIKLPQLSNPHVQRSLRHKKGLRGQFSGRLEYAHPGTCIATNFCMLLLLCLPCSEKHLPKF
jgi:hypothetical protein